MNFAVLKQPYPKLFNNWKITSVVSVFVVLFLLVFEPFGLSEFKNANKTWILLGYGAVTAFTLIINLILLPKIIPTWFIPEKWTVLKEILFLLWILFCIGSCNYLYTHFLFNLIGNFFLFQIYTLSVGAIPIVIITLISQNIILKRNFKSANQLNSLILNHQDFQETVEPFTLLSDKYLPVLELHQNDLLFVESEGNYVRIHYLNKGIIDSKQIRNTLKNIKQQLAQFPNIVKCHRAFLVNINCISESSGNALGLSLSIKESTLKVPVSRNYVQAIRELLS